MTSPFRFDGTGEPETEEERRKRQLREAMRAAQLGLPLASQLPAVTITAPRSSMLDASARRTADLTAAFESALAETERRRQSPMERLAGFEMPEVAPDVTAAPTGRTRRRPATISEQPESLLSKALNVAAQIPVQSMLAGGRMREAVESTPLGRLTPGTAAGARLTQEAVEERFGPRSGLARAVAVPAAFAGEVVPYFAAGAGIPGLLRSAAITGLTSQRPGGSTVEALGELSGSETLKRLAESPLRTAADVGLDVGINVLPGAVSGLTRGFREAARITGGGVGTTRALARQAAQNIAEGARQVGPAARAIGQQLAAEPLTTAAIAASVAGEAAVPGAGLLAAALPATTRPSGRFVPMAEESISAVPTLPSESRAFDAQGYIERPENYRAANNLLAERQHRDNVRSIVVRANPGGIFDGTTQTTGLGLYGDVSPNTITRWTPDTDDAKVRRTASVLGLIEGQQAQMPHRLARQGDELMASDGMSGRTKGYVMTGPDEGPLTPDDAATLLSIAQRNGLAGGTFDEQTGRVYFINIKGLSGQSDEEFLRSVSRVAEDAGDALPIRIEDGDLYAEYIDGPSRYLSILGDNIEDVRNARNVLDLVAPEYERFAESIGADVTKTRDRLAATRALLDGRIDAIARAEGPLGQMQRELAGVKDETVEIAASRARADTEARLKARRDRTPVDLSVGTPAQRQMRAVKLGLDDLRDAVKRFGKSASEWYSKQGQQASAQMQTLIPELRGSPEKRFVANTILALTSSGATVEDNLARALPIIRQYIKTGQITQLDVSRGVQNAEAMGPLMAEQVGQKRVRQGIWPTDLKGSTRAQAVESGLRKLQLFLDANGGDEKAVRDFFQQTYKTKVGDIPTSADVFGPKVGRFLMNVEGMGGEVTVDSWALRTWMRWMGYGDEARLAFDKEAVTKDNPQGLVLRGGPTPEENAEIRESFTRLARQISKETGENFDPADVQALLWYLEKFNYGKWGSKSELESFADVGNRFVMAGREPMPQMSSVAGTPFRFEFGAGPTTSGLERKATKDYLTQRGAGFRTYDITGAVPEAIRQTLASPAASAATGAIAGAVTDEEDRFRGAFVGAAAGAGLAAGVRGTKTYLRNRAALKASGFSPELADAYTIAKGGIDFTGAEAQKIAKAQRGGFRDIVKRGIDSFADAQRELDRLAGKAEARGMAPEASVGTALDIALSSDVTAARALRRGLGVERGGIIDPITREFMGEPLEDVFKPLGGSPAKNEQALTYAVALRNVGRYDKAMAAGDPDALRIYGGNAERMIADRQIVEAFGQRPEFQEFANRMEQYFANLSEYAVRSGLWTPQQAQAIRESDTFYVPFKRLIEAYTGGGAGPMGGRPTPGRVGPGVKRFTGSDLMIGNPAETIASYTAALIRRADMYRVGSTLIDTVEQLGPEAAGLLTKIDAGDPMARALGVADAEAAYRQLGLPEEEAKQVADLFVRMDDKNPVITRNTPQGKEYYLVNDPAVYNALMTLNPQDGQAAKAIVAIFGPLKRLGTAFATGFSPQFWFGTNVPKDLVLGLAQNPNITVGDVAVGIKEAAKSVVGRSEMVEQLSRAGMGQVSQYGGPPSPEAIARQIAPTTTGQAVAAEMGQAISAPLRGLERVGRATELPMRLAAARAAQRTAAGAGVSPRGQMALASRRGATATVDFRRRAGTAFERLLEGTVMYYGAAKKGGVWFARAAKNNPERMGAAAGVITLGTVLEYMMSKGEERREFVDRPASERARYLHVGPTRIALPQEFAALAAGVRIGLAQLEKDDPFVFEQFKESLFNMLPPIYTDIAKGDIAAAVTPFPVARQAVELSRNRSAFGDRPIVSQSMARRLPEARRYETTAPTYDVLARGARAIGLEEASPIQAEFAARGIFGRFAPAVTALTDVVAAPMAGQQAAERVPLPMSRQPLNPVTGFTARPVTRGQSEQEFYNIRSEVQQAKATLSALQTARAEAKKRGDQQALNENTAQVRRLLDENPTFAAVFADRNTKRIDKVFSSLEDKLDKADARRDAITTQFRNKKMTGQRARQLLDENDKKRAELFRRGFEILNERVPR